MKSATTKTGLLVCACVVAASTAEAQDFSSIQLKNLPVVFVEEKSGAETRGRLLSITPAAIAIDVDGSQRTFAPADVVKIDRRGDSLKNGALIGAGIDALIPGRTRLWPAKPR